MDIVNRDRFRVFNEFYWNEDCLYVSEDKMIVSGGDNIIGTMGVITCLGITLYDRFEKKGAMAHITGFGSGPRDFDPENIVYTLLDGLCGVGVCKDSLEASLFGESIRMFNGKKSDIVRAHLGFYDIPIIGEDLGGGDVSRRGFLDCSNGNVEVCKI